MKKGYLAGLHPATQLLFAGLVLVASWIAFQIFAMLSGMVIFSLSASEILTIYNSFNDPVMIGFLKYIQAFTSIGMFIFAAILAANFISPDWKLFLGFTKNPGWAASLLAAAFIIVVLPFTNLLGYINTNIHLPDFLAGVETFFRDKETQMTEIMESLLKPSGVVGLFINLLVVAIIPAIGEELTFRGIIQKLLIRWFRNPHWAIFLTAFLFSAIHFQFLSFLPRFFLGMVLGYLYYWSGSIWLTMLVHFINNAVAVVYYNFYYGGQTGNFLEKVGTPDSAFYLAIAGGVSGAVLLFLIHQKYKTENPIS